MRYNLIPISNIRSDILIIRSSQRCQENFKMVETRKYTNYTSIIYSSKHRITTIVRFSPTVNWNSRSPILEEILSRATNFHSQANAIDGSRVSKAKMSKMLEIEGQIPRKQDRPFKDIVETVSGDGRGEEEMGLFSVLVDPRIFVGGFYLLKWWIHSSSAYLFENQYLEIFVARNWMVSLRG